MTPMIGYLPGHMKNGVSERRKPGATIVNNINLIKQFVLTEN
jgi:hypothetical protein